MTGLDSRLNGISAITCVVSHSLNARTSIRAASFIKHNTRLAFVVQVGYK